MSRYLQGTLHVYCLNCHASNLHFNVQTLKMQFFVQLQLYLVATSTTRAVSTTWHKHHGDRYSSLVWCLSTRVFCGMMDGLAFLPVLDLTNGIHLLRTLCPDDPPKAAELLDYLDSTYISGRLRQQNPAQNQAVRLVLTRSPPVSTSHLERTWYHSQRWCQNQQHVRGLEQQFLQPGRTCPSVYMACHRVVSKGRSYCPYYYPARCRR